MQKGIKQQNRLKSYLILIIMIFIVLTIIFLMSGCSREVTFTSYKQVSDYCYNKTIDINCSLEKCIMLNSAEFTDQIKFSAEKNYLQCELQHCQR